MNEDQEYQLGWDAYWREGHRAQNPHKIGTIAHNEWSRGYLDAAWDDEQHSAASIF